MKNKTTFINNRKISFSKDKQYVLITFATLSDTFAISVHRTYFMKMLTSQLEKEAAAQ